MESTIQPTLEVSPGIFLHTCLIPRCKHVWSSRNERPGVCPKCKQKDWDNPHAPVKKGPRPKEVK